MALYRGSSLSQLQRTRIPPVISGSAKQSRAFCGNTRDFSKICYRVPASRIREGLVTHGHGIVASPASSPEPPVRKELESPPRQEHSPASWVERWLPAAARPYALLARLDKPDAIWLYAWPCFWYVSITSYYLLDFRATYLHRFLCHEFFLGHSSLQARCYLCNVRSRYIYVPFRRCN